MGRMLRHIRIAVISGSSLERSAEVPEGDIAKPTKHMEGYSTTWLASPSMQAAMFCMPWGQPRKRPGPRYRVPNRNQAVGQRRNRQWPRGKHHELCLTFLCIPYLTEGNQQVEFRQIRAHILLSFLVVSVALDLN